MRMQELIDSVQIYLCCCGKCIKSIAILVCACVLHEYQYCVILAFSGNDILSGGPVILVFWAILGAEKMPFWNSLGAATPAFLSSFGAEKLVFLENLE